MEDNELAATDPARAPDAPAEAPVDPVSVFPCAILVNKYGDAIPVTCNDRASYDRLAAIHGEANLTVQS